MDCIDVRFEDILDGPLSRVDPDLVASKDTSDFNSVTSFADIDEIIVGAERDRMRSLSIGYTVWSLLQLDDLLVREPRSVVDDLEGVWLVAASTPRWFRDLATIDIDFDGVRAKCTLEER